MITVAIPVGPHPENVKYLGECLLSLTQQTFQDFEVLIIDDMAGIGLQRLLDEFSKQFRLGMRLHLNPWLSGVAHSFNYGVALAENELVLMLGSDDFLHPHCLEALRDAYRKDPHPLGYYWLDVFYTSSGETQGLPCNAAMVTKKLWQNTGGFPVQSAVGAPDHVFINMMQIHGGDAGKLIHVETSVPYYHYRDHEETFTKREGATYGPIVPYVRDTFATKWERPSWTLRRLEEDK